MEDWRAITVWTPFRGHLLEMAGDHQAAIAHYRAAAAGTTSTPEWNYLTTQAARLAAAAK